MTVLRITRMHIAVNLTNDWWGWKVLQQYLLKVHTSFAPATQFLEIYPQGENVPVGKVSIKTLFVLAKPNTTANNINMYQ